MPEPYTDRARKVLRFARDEAVNRHHEFVGTEHMLLGLIREGAGVGALALRNLHINLDDVRHHIDLLLPPGPALSAGPPAGHMTIFVRVLGCLIAGRGPMLQCTPRAWKAREFAAEEARSLHHDYLGTEHLLLGLLREKDGVACQVLQNLGVSLDAARNEVVKLIGGSQG